MYRLITWATALAMIVAGLLGITLSVPLESPSVVLVGLIGLLAGGLVFFGVNTRIKSQWLLTIGLMAIVYFIFRACYSPVVDLGIEDLMLILPAGTIYLVAGYNSESEKIKQGLAWAVVCLLVLHLGSAIMQMTGREGYSLSRYFTSADRATDSTITGMYGYRGSFANFAVLSGLLCLSLGMLGRYGKATKLLLLSLGGVALIFAVMSQSRSAVISLIVAFFVFGTAVYISLSSHMNSTKRRLRPMIVMGFVLVLMAGLFGAVWVFQGRATDASGLDVVFDSEVRLAFWPMAIEQWIDNPIVGAGSRSYSYECFSYWNPNLSTGEANPEFVHNEYLQLLADYGLVGFSLVAALLVGHGAVGLKRIMILSQHLNRDEIMRGNNTLALTIAGVSGIVAMSVHIVFDFRTHLLANLLLLICCAVWVIPRCAKQGGGDGSNFFRYLIATSLMLLGLIGVFLGSLQLWGGWPLLSNKMAKEEGAWEPRSVQRDQWIPALETATERTPHFRRYLRLGALYTVEALEHNGEQRQIFLDQAIDAYQKASERHPYELVSQINVAKIETVRGQFEKANMVYSKIARAASSRERWFKMHSLWADMHLRWAIVREDAGAAGDAEIHYLRSMDLYKESCDLANLHQNHEWQVSYTKALLMYSRFLDKGNRHDEAENIHNECMKLSDWVNNNKYTNIFVERGMHYYLVARYHWFKREPGKAATKLKVSLQMYEHHQKVTKGQVNDFWKKNYQAAKDMDNFFRKTGITGKK